MKDAKNRLTELARLVERGERVVVTRHGKEVLELVPPRKKGLDMEAGQRWLQEHGISDPFPYIAPDFDDPLPEDFLIKPVPAKSESASRLKTKRVSPKESARTARRKTKAR